MDNDQGKHYRPAGTAGCEVEYSRFVQRTRRRYQGVLSLMPEGVPEAGLMRQMDALFQPQFPRLADRLRVIRNCVLERLVVLDCQQAATLQMVTTAMTDLAEFSINMAFADAMHQLTQIYGTPNGADGKPAVFWIIGMGKLGARELNVSSDIDVVYVFDQEGETSGRADGAGVISNHDFYSRLVKILFATIGEVSEHGLVFRMDLALRPNGNSGPAVVSLAALEEYFMVQGREWERFAWLKSRVIAPKDSLIQARQLRDVILPFVFRRYLDYSVFQALRNLHQQISEHSFKRSSGQIDRYSDVKLSQGGIRQIEFIVQLLQVVRGGQYPELRTRGTQKALQHLSAAGLMPKDTANGLNAAYIFLRKVEHRIQYLDDQQTHILPKSAQDMLWLSQAMGFSNTDEFLKQLKVHRDLVAFEFESLLGIDKPSKTENTPINSSPVDGSRGWQQVLEKLTGEFRERILTWVDHPKINVLREEGLARLLTLVLRTQEWINQEKVTLLSAVRWADWLETLVRRESYLALMVERVEVHQQLLHLLGAARWPAHYLLLHPGVIDELASPSMLSDRFSASEFQHELEIRRQALKLAGQDDDENLLNLLRRAQHAELFRTLARDIEGRLTVEQVADDLSALADAVLQITVNWVWARIAKRHCEIPRIAIVGYGKLGGKELGYGSDLDIVFIYQDEHEQAYEIYSMFVRKLINWLTVKTAEGDLYEIDTALRPNGSSGLLVSDFDAFFTYQTQRGSNTAWTWEHQAMTRARFCTGLPELADQFENLRKQVISAPRDHILLAQEIENMRQRIKASHPVKAGQFDIKHSAGGMVDVEFAVQYLILAYSSQYQTLLDNVGNIALLVRAENCGLLPAGVGTEAANAYRTLRKVQHKARLDEQPTQLDSKELKKEQAAVGQLWRSVFDNTKDF